MLESFLLRVEQGYSKYNNPYHNLVHGADVAQTTHYIMSQSGLAVSIHNNRRAIIREFTWGNGTILENGEMWIM